MIVCVLQHYYVGSYRTSQALVIIEHDTHHNLYLSDETGTYYSLSLEDLAVGEGIDLEIVSNLITVCTEHNSQTIFQAFFDLCVQIPV